jgi:hypothetical protein
MKFPLASSCLALASAAQASPALDFERFSPGTLVSGFPGGDFIGRATVESGGPTGNFVHLAPDPSFSVPTEAMEPVAHGSWDGTAAYTERGFISSFDVRLAAGGTMLYGHSSMNRLTLVAGQWYHFHLWTSYIVKFHSAGGADLDNLTVFETLMTVRPPRRFVP